MPPTAVLRSRRLTFSDYDEMLDALEERGIGDGLPIVPPTPQRVARAVEASGRDPAEVIGRIPPLYGEATVEKVAIHGVMAGCQPEYLGVVLTALEAILDGRFDLLGVQTTTHPVGPFVLVSGPEAERLGVHGGAGAFGPGHRANATIGRAIRLILLNLGGARPGVLDGATMGSPAKYTYCVAENERESPWEPLRVALGFSLEDSVVVVAGLESPHNINDYRSANADQILTSIAGVMSTGERSIGGATPFLFLCPEHARDIAAGGYRRKDVQRFIFERARTPVELLGDGQLQHLLTYYREHPRFRELGLDRPDVRSIPLVARPEDLIVAVVGGAGRHSMWAGSMGSLTHYVARRLMGGAPR